jgi:hypothetical protein
LYRFFETVHFAGWDSEYDEVINCIEEQGRFISSKPNNNPYEINNDSKDQLNSEDEDTSISPDYMLGLYASFSKRPASKLSPMFNILSSILSSVPQPTKKRKREQ